MPSRPNKELESYFRDVRRFSPLRREEERALGRRFRRGDKAAGQALVAANLRFVVKIAGEYRSSGLSISDLVQEGNLGLMRAVSKFDPERGLRLISYAVWWIRAYIRAYVLRSWSLVRIGTTQAQRRLFFALGREYRYLREAGSERDPSDARPLAEHLSVKPSEVIEMRTRVSARDVSLDAPVARDSDVTLLHRLNRADERSPERQLVESEEARLLSRRVRVALSRLVPRERLIVERRLLSEGRASLQRLAEELGVSAERVRQLEMRANLKIRAALDSFADMSNAA
jgi:RNA polymerase sigma-32 factor